MVASITLLSGNLPDLSTAIFAMGDNTQTGSLFDALMAAVAQGDNGASGQEPAAPLTAEPGVEPAPFPALPFPLPLPATPPQIENPVFLLNEAANTEGSVSLPTAAPEALAPLAAPDVLSPQPPASTLPLDASPPETLMALLTEPVPAASANDALANVPSDSAPVPQPEQTAESNPPPIQIRLALANIPGAPALIVRNIIIAQLPLEAQGPEKPASDPSAGESAAQDGNIGATMQIAAPPVPSPAVNVPAPQTAPPAPLSMPDTSAVQTQPALAIVLAQLFEPAQGDETVTSAPPPKAPGNLAPEAPSNDVPNAAAPSASPPTNGDDSEHDGKVRDNSSSVTLDAFVELVIVPTPAPPAPPPIASEAETTPAIAIDTNAAPKQNPAAPAEPPPTLFANAAPRQSANPGPEAQSADRENPVPATNAMSEAPSIAEAKPQANPQPIPPGFRIAGATSQRAKPAAVPQAEFPPLAEAVTSSSGNPAPSANGTSPRVDAQPDATPPDTGEATKSSDASQSAPKAKTPEHAAPQSLPEPSSNLAAPPPAPPIAAQGGAAPLDGAVAPTAADAAISLNPAIWTQGPGDPADTPVRVPLLTLAGWPDSAMFDALALKIAAKSSDGAANFQIRLDPPELGRIEVNLSVDADGNAGASLTADKPQTLDLLQRDSGALERALKDAGLDLTGGLSFSLKGEARSGAWRDTQGGRARSLSIGAIEAGVAGAAGVAIPTLYGNGASGRLDITV